MEENKEKVVATEDHDGEASDLWKQKNENAFEEVWVHEKFDDEEYDVLYHKQPVSAGFRTDFFDELKPCTEYINGIRYDRDVEIPLSEGRKVYVDVYRPENQLENLPVIMMWTPYGKRHWHGRAVTPGLHQAIGVPKDTISDMAALENIRIPVYACAGYSHFHLRGSMEGFRRIKSRNKWLRMHRDFEWPDFNKPENAADLKLFFDRYLKEIHNGWEMTPKVRIEVMDAYDFDFQTNRPEMDFPIPRTQFTKFYLNASDKSLSTEASPVESTITYNSETEEVCFDMEVTEDMELSGNFVLRTWVSSETDDADVFVFVQKADKDGNMIPTTVFGVADPGAKGQLRASMRALDEEKSLPYLPQYKFTKREPLNPGEPVALDIEIWPYSRIWHKGEKLRVMIAGRPVRDQSWFLPTAVDSINKGNHTIYTGGKYDTYLLAPVIPPKYKSGDYVVR